MNDWLIPRSGSPGHDVIAQAQSGTGKTATFATAVLQRIDTAYPQCQAIILAPTRELANQVKQTLKLFCSDISYVKTHILVLRWLVVVGTLNKLPQVFAIRSFWLLS